LLSLAIILDSLIEFFFISGDALPLVREYLR